MRPTAQRAQGKREPPCRRRSGTGTSAQSPKARRGERSVAKHKARDGKPRMARRREARGVRGRKAPGKESVESE